MLLAITRAKPFTTGAAHRGCAGGWVTALFGVQIPLSALPKGSSKLPYLGRCD